MNYNIDTRGLLGFKELSFADLGIGNSHQTHIGLYGRVLETIGNNAIIPSSILIFGNTYHTLDCYFDRIQNLDGSFRSPKIRSGQSDSIVRKIREYAIKYREPLYLLWFGLTNGKIVFFLMTSHEEDFKMFKKELKDFGVHDFSISLTKYIMTRLNSIPTL